MKNTAKIRQLLTNAQNYAEDNNIKRLNAIDARQTYKWIMQDMFKCIDKALTLLDEPFTIDNAEVPEGYLLIKADSFLAKLNKTPSCPDCDGNMDIETLKKLDKGCGDNLSHGQS